MFHSEQSIRMFSSCDLLVLESKCDVHTLLLNLLKRAIISQGEDIVTAGRPGGGWADWPEAPVRLEPGRCPQ